MNVGFYLTSGDAPGYVYADALVRSVRAVMPDVPVHQFTDMTSPSVWGIDATQRLPSAPLSMLRSAHYASVKGEWLFVDTDVIIQRDVRDVFDYPDDEQVFKIAVTSRNWSHVPPLDESFATAMPYCAGVVFSRWPKFWQEVHEAVARMSAKDQNWFGDQRAMCDILATHRYFFTILDGSIYQYPPQSDGPELSQAAIVHYKGPSRKKLLMYRIQQELALA